VAAFSAQDRISLDTELSRRAIKLDPQGYLLIKLDRARGELLAEWFSNNINDQGLATDPATGEVLACRGNGPREPIQIFKGRSAKELGIAITEAGNHLPISSFDHALYLGREFQKAEYCLETNTDYIQD
jgi:dihydropteroate synthase